MTAVGVEQEETSEELACKAVPACVWAVADFVKRQKFWQGTATELLAAAGIADVQPNQLTRRLVEFYPPIWRPWASAARAAAPPAPDSGSAR
ncbi:MAG: hypothetical protein ACLU9S_02900 [Oscillospiraceae bacterium]